MDKLIKEDIPRAKMFHGTFRFVDDLCALNDGENFQKSYKEIYLKELVLKFEPSGYHAAFLNLNIAISNGKISQFVIFKPLNYCFEETIGFDVNASFASRPESRLIR